MYLIGIKNGVHPLGNAGTLRTSYRADYKIIDLAHRFANAYQHDEVYTIRQYTQLMSEMTGQQFVEYVRNTGTRIL